MSMVSNALGTTQVIELLILLCHHFLENIAGNATATVRDGVIVLLFMGQNMK